MENLKYPKEHFLLNNPNAEDVIAKTSGVLFPKFGLNFSSSDTLEVMYPGTGHSNGVFLALYEKATVKDGDPFSFGYSVKRKERLPGIRNIYPDDSFISRPYFSEIKALNVTSGIIDASDQELILSKLLTIVKADEDNVESQFFNTLKAYYVSVDSSSAAASVDITANGSLVTIDNGSTFTADALSDAINANATAKLYVLSILVSSDTILVISKENAGDFVLKAHANTTDLKKGIAVFGRNMETKVITTVNQDFMTPEEFTLVSMSYAAISSAAEGTFQISYADSLAGTSDPKTVANATASAAAGTVAGHNRDLYADAIGDDLYIVNHYGYTGSYKAGSIIRSYTSELEFTTNALHKGVFPMTTADDIFREQAGIYNGMGAAVRQNQALENTEYAVLNFTLGGKSPALSSGASSIEEFETKYSIAINKEALNDVKWNATYDGAGTAKTLVDVIKSVFTSANFI